MSKFDGNNAKKTNLKTGVTIKQSTLECTLNFPKNEHFEPLDTHRLVRVRIRKVRNVSFRKIWRALFSCNTRFQIHPFALLPTNCR